MREQLPRIIELHFLEGNINNTIERAYEAGRIDGVLQYLEEQIKKQKEEGKNE
jgi:hypothetical protein